MSSSHTQSSSHFQSSSYSHTQTGVVLRLIFGAALAITVWIAYRTEWEPVLFLTMAVLVVCGIVFSSLRVEVDGRYLTCRFGAGLIRKRFALRDIGGVEPVRNPWYYGWGIRWTPRGWLFNVSGLDAVELSLTSGKHFRIGTDQPQELTAALRRATGC